MIPSTGHHFYVGRRISYDAQRCTVRYCGPLANTKGVWIGVEWDDPTRGKHDGTHQGQRIFTCLSNSSSCASFLRASRQHDTERTVLEAIKYKYCTDESGQHAAIEVGGKIAEEVGFEKVAAKQAQLTNLRVALVDTLCVYGLLPRDSNDHDSQTNPKRIEDAQQELRTSCPNIVEINLGWNLIEKWQQIVDIYNALPTLRVLRIGGLRLRCFDSSASQNMSTNIQALHLEENLITYHQVQNMLIIPYWPVLRELDLSDNDLTLSNAGENYRHPLSSTVQSLKLDNNHIKTLDCLGGISQCFPKLNSLSVQNNMISTISNVDLPAGKILPDLHTLNLSYNQIKDYRLVDTLSVLLPKLTNLRISNNPLHAIGLGSRNDVFASEKYFYLTLARLPQIEVLNNTQISKRDRDEGEIYYLSVTNDELDRMFSAAGVTTREELVHRARIEHPQYERLVLKHNRSNKIFDLSHDSSLGGQNGNPDTQPQPDYPAGSLGARLVETTFYLPLSPASKKDHVDNELDPTIVLSLPKTIPTSTIMAILVKHKMLQSYLKPLQFNMIIETNELDPIDPTTESTTRSTLYRRKGMTTEEQNAIWQEWGNWDVDAADESSRADVIQNNDEEQGGIRGGTSYQQQPPLTVDRVPEDAWQIDVQGQRFIMQDGRKWQRREIPIKFSIRRAWGDDLENGTRTATVRLEVAR